ncbi:uncharacterized protein B0I36DRAFT_414073 [Microdochium trichocladiopsis]|uniref:Uncharacterized protein n=1 Tax=Microdochium trichocladiopsis TaxID=1682393 RepID=A0A9P9BME1_9PEZI|nr:uncharacterized protein B0I36DRAFT_414073 [Microdochium trichocladiopsis]KAH7025751.1 hypothetical protein B0I36DRAFT_414073 [Microdochium trichocladiopsis]
MLTPVIDNGREDAVKGPLTIVDTNEGANEPSKSGRLLTCGSNARGWLRASAFHSASLSSPSPVRLRESLMRFLSPIRVHQGQTSSHAQFHKIRELIEASSPGQDCLASEGTFCAITKLGMISGVGDWDCFQMVRNPADGSVEPGLPQGPLCRSRSPCRCCMVDQTLYLCQLAILPGNPALGLGRGVPLFTATLELLASSSAQTAGWCPRVLVSGTRLAIPDSGTCMVWCSSWCSPWGVDLGEARGGKTPYTNERVECSGEAEGASAGETLSFAAGYQSRDKGGPDRRAPDCLAGGGLHEWHFVEHARYHGPWWHAMQPRVASMLTLCKSDHADPANQQPSRVVANT